ncbi:MAG TPA: presenilin family intramembrane aspartyl protease [Candidatus Nanoarchaeia archaeon]|nr:presenilin family intramembrane aspartyl protease [Candidatus Nanoarchaeia archaeon]
MKHNIKVTVLIALLFLLAQIIGLLIVNHYLDKDLPYNIERPKLNEKTSALQVFLTILIVTALVFLIMKYRIFKLWTVWFYLASTATLMIAFSTLLNQNVAFVLALILAYFKLRRNIFIHNFTELFIYGGLAAIFVPVINLTSIIILLVIISVYDFIAVFKTKHMVKMAKFQTKMRVFPGLLIPYRNKVALLGGGDIGFPLLFAGIMMKDFGNIAFAVPLFCTAALLVLLFIGKKDKFYPAMPFMTTGCLLSLTLLLL